ncbi:MAG: M48 family metallopeptidase [Thermoproteota archaeon]
MIRMINVNNLNFILLQFLHPYFYYPTIILAVSFTCVKAVIKYNNHLLTAKIKSICYLLPLLLPLLTMLFGSLMLFSFSIFIGRTFYRSIFLNNDLFYLTRRFPDQKNIMALLLTSNPLRRISHISLTKILCITGSVASITYLAITITLGDKIVKKLFHVIELEPYEYTFLQRSVRELSGRLGIDPPKIGLVEDLRPNAFTVGYGDKKMIVFSLGILKILKKRELEAVVAHELTHIKNRDYFFKTLLNTLVLLSFFNPLAYFSSAAAQREREILADEEGVRILGKPGLLINTLAKICRVSRVFPREGVVVSLTSGLFLASSVFSGRAVLSTHPKLDQRVENIKWLSSREKPTGKKLAVSVAISTLIITVGILVTYLLALIPMYFIRPPVPAMLPKVLFMNNKQIFAYESISMNLEFRNRI